MSPAPRGRREFFRQDVLLDARLATKNRSRRVALSVGAHALVVAALLVLPKSESASRAVDDVVRVVFFAPAPPAPAPEPMPMVQPQPRATPRPHPAPKPEPAPRFAVAPPPRDPEPVPAPRPVETARVRPSPPPPRRAVTGVFGDAPASPVPALARKAVVAAGGFEVAQAAPAPERAPRAVAPSRFEIDASPAAPRPSAARAVASADFEIEAPSPRRAAASAGVVIAASFDAGNAESRRAASPGGVVRAASFDDQAAAPAPRAAVRRRPDAEVPLEIVSKPRPGYTEQARRLRVEGEVVLDVMFFANGRISVVRVVEGLGYGLDEAAIEAARKIEFSPARRDGRPIDHEATLRIVFRLA